jgi:hypothetical protein
MRNCLTIFSRLKEARMLLVLAILIDYTKIGKCFSFFYHYNSNSKIAYLNLSPPTATNSTHSASADHDHGGYTLHAETVCTYSLLSQDINKKR